MTREFDRAGEIGAAILRFRRMRSDEFPRDLFSDHPWDFLLELFVADAKGQRLTGRQIGSRTGIPERVASAWLLHLSKLGLVHGDGDGDLDDPLTLSARAMESMERLIKEANVITDLIVTERP